MNIKINNEESFKEEIISIINNLSERISVIEDTMLSESEDRVDDLENKNNENCCDVCKKGCNLSEHLVSDLIVSMQRLREYDLQKYREYYDYLEDDDDIISDLNSAYYEE